MAEEEEEGGGRGGGGDQPRGETVTFVYKMKSGRLGSLDPRPQMHQSVDGSTEADSIWLQTCVHMCTDYTRFKRVEHDAG